MLEVWFSTFLILFVIGGVTVLANLAERERRLRSMLYAAILGLNGLLLLYPLLVAITPVPVDDPATTGLSVESADETTRSDGDLGAAEIVPAVLLAIISTGVTTLFLLQAVRTWLARFFPKAGMSVSSNDMLNQVDIRDVETLFPVSPQPQAAPKPGFDPGSTVHMWAGVLVIHFLAYQLMSFFLAGGLSGVAEDIGVSYGILIANFMPTVLIPVLGVGFLIRRNPQETLKRLGLHMPSAKGFALALALAIGLLMVVVMVSVIWQGLVSEETFREQTEASNALAESVNTLGLAFVLALTAGIGEEIAFRGALQPIFGFWFTAVTFVLAHLQYTLTPASLIILFVAVVLGLIRKRFDTTTAILTHFLYNFIPLALPLLFSEPGWILHLL